MPSIIYLSTDLALTRTKLAATYPTSTYRYLNLEGEGSIKIETIRALLASLSITTDKPRLVLVQPADALTPAAQNALLKALEEPPVDTTFALVTNNLSSLLPTIRSRCTLVRLSSPTLTLDEGPLALVKSALKLPAGERLALTKELGKDREEAIAWFDSLLTSLYLTMQKTEGEKQLKFLGGISTLATEISTSLASNVNVTLALQSFLLRLPRLK